METLGMLVSAARAKTHYTQESLAEKVEKSKQWMGAIERGGAVPTLKLLLRLHEELVQSDDRDPNSELRIWLLRWLEATLKQQVGICNDAALVAVRELYGQRQVRKMKRAGSTLPTLEDFPHDFENLVIVCGDRRESPPKTKGDLFVDSFSCADLGSLKTLFERSGPLDIRSDKSFVLADRDYLKREYGQRNIIVVGSPAVNLLARAINKYCVFRFSIPKVARDFLKYLDKEIPEINDPELRTIFWDMASKWREPPEATIGIADYYEKYKNRGLRMPREQIQVQIDELARKVKELLKDHTAKEMKHFFRKPGFVDPVDTRLQGYFTRQDNDFGVISLCPNPYSDDSHHFCILVAGIHAPGTDAAVRALATNNFKDHPLGGIIEAKLDLDAGWIDRFINASADWQTTRYEVEDVLANLRNPKDHSIFHKCEPGDIEALISFVERFSSVVIAKQ